jgi:cell division protein FtsB
MQNFKTKFRQLIYFLKHDFFTRDRLFITAVAIICLAFLIGAVSAMGRNWKLAHTISEKERELAVLELEIDNAKSENEYYASAEYQELAIRHAYDKVMPGEKLVYLPNTSDEAKVKDSAKETNTATQQNPEDQSVANLKEWLSFLLGI